MDLVTGATGSLIPKLLQLLGDEYKLQTGMKQKVQFLAWELESIHAFLRKVSDVPLDQLDEQVKVWAREAREASYDMEDILDTFLVRVEGRKPEDDTRRLKRAMKKIANLFSEGKARHDIGSAINNIKSQLQEVADRRARYRIDDIVVDPATTTSNVDPRLRNMYKEAANLVGIDKPRDDLVSMLSSQVGDITCKKRIVAIVGIGGLGKTTLAKAVYDKLKPDFVCGAFVPVGRNPNLTKVLMDILYELDKFRFADIHTKNRDERQLIDNLREFLIHKRYFIVIDDIWENKSWTQAIELALLENNYGSRIIITTRNSQVAKEINGVVYKMPPLSNGNSKNLFYTRIFCEKEEWPDNEPDEIPNKILKKCGGVPLAIITMASLLVGKPREKWSDVFTSVGFGNKEDKEVDITMKILSYSFYDMPAHLRTCLLYLIVYPEDYFINKKNLIWKWVAEGFIQGEQGIPLFELGELYFNDLVNRSMIQAIENKWDGTVKGCRVHDMVLDLICSISSEENFVTILDNDEGTVSPPPSSARRIAFHKNTMDETRRNNMVGMPKVRSVIAIICTFGNLVPFSSFKLLRVLDMEGCKNVRPSHLVHLENLLHLRYLGLQACKGIDELPNEIGSLKLLQIVNLVGTKIKQLPASISRLTQLVCLKYDSEDMMGPSWIGKLTSLEELHVSVLVATQHQPVNSDRGFWKGLGNLRELRVLDCRFYEKMDETMQRDLVLSLCNLRKLQRLDFRDGHEIDADTSTWGEEGFVLPRHLRILNMDYFHFSCLPSCIGAACLSNLTHLSLNVDALERKDLELMGRLPELCYLSLGTKSTVTLSNINISNSYFQKLRFCSIYPSMIQFRCKEGDPGVSVHIWNGIDAMPFGSGKNKCSLAPYAVMPSLEVLESWIYVRTLEDGKCDCSNSGLEYLRSLREVEVTIIHEGALAVEADEAEAALWKAIEVHPNGPMLEVHRMNERTFNSIFGDQKPENDDVLAKEENQKQQQEEEEPTADVGVTKSSILNS